MTQRMPPPTPLALTATNAARVLGISRGSVYRLLSTGDLKAKKAGDATLVLMSSIEAYLESLPDFVSDRIPEPLKSHPRGWRLRAVK